MKPELTFWKMPRLLALGFVCILVGAIGFLLIQRSAPLSTLLSVFPKETILVVEWDNASHAWARWRKSIFFNDKERVRSFKLVGIPESQLSLGEMDKLAGLYDAFASDPSVQALFNARAALAVLPELEGQSPKAFSLARQWVLAVHANGSFSIEHHSDLTKLLKLDTVTVFQGESIGHFILPDGEKLVSWQRPGVILWAPEERLLHQCIHLHFQQMIRRHASLSDNPIWQRMKAQFGANANVFGYANLERLYPLLPWVQELVDKAAVVKPQHIALYQYFGEQSDSVGGVALIDREVISALVGTQQHSSPQEPLPGNLTDATALLFWTNWFNFKEVWAHIVQQANEETAAFLATVEQAVAENMGGSIDTFFDVFGQRIGVFINDQGTPYQANRSLGCLAIEVRDQGQVERLIKQLLAGLQVITVQSEAMEIHTVMLAGGLLQPAYSLVKNRLIVADNLELIEQARRYFSLHEQGSASEQPVQPARQGNFFLFIRPTTVIDRILPALTMAAKENGDRNRFFAPETRLKLRETLLPLLSGLQDVKTLSIHGSAAGDSIAIEVTYALNAR